MRTFHRLPLAIVTVVAAAISVGCGDDTNDSASTTPATASSTPETMSSTPATVSAATPADTVGTSAGGAVLFSDDFTDDTNRWGVVDDPQFGSATFDDGDYVWAFRGSIAHWLAAVVGEQYDAGQLDMLDVQVSAELTIVTGTGVAGVFCRENPDSDADWQWYDFVVRDGYTAIRLADQEGNLTALAENRDVELPLGAPIALAATCRNNNEGGVDLSMAINGASVLDVTVSDDPLTNGAAGLSAWTFPLHEQMDIVWHSFEVRAAG